MWTFAHWAKPVNPRGTKALAAAKGRLVKKANEEELADFCITTIQGGMLLAR